MLSLPSAKRIGPIPYRSSKLTRIMQPSLNGNSRVAIICCVDPSPAHANETERTLEFARCAKDVETNAQANKAPASRGDVDSGEPVHTERINILQGKLAIKDAKLASKDDEIAKRDEEIKQLKAALSSSRLELTLTQSEAETGHQETEAGRHSDSHLFSSRVNGENTNTRDDSADILHQALVAKASDIGELQIKHERAGATIKSLCGEHDTLRDANATLESLVQVEADRTAAENKSHINVVEGFVAQIKTLQTELDASTKHAVELEKQCEEHATRRSELEKEVQVLQNDLVLVKEKATLADEALALLTEKSAQSELEDSDDFIQMNHNDDDDDYEDDVLTVNYSVPVSDESQIGTEGSDSDDGESSTEAFANDSDTSIVICPESTTASEESQVKVSEENDSDDFIEMNHDDDDKDDDDDELTAEHPMQVSDESQDYSDDGMGPWYGDDDSDEATVEKALPISDESEASDEDGTSASINSNDKSIR